MSNLKETLRADLASAMKSHDAETVGTIRMVLTAISRAEVSGDQARELSDDDVVAVLTSETKRRREAAAAFAAAGRDELAAKENAEAAVLARYLPEPLSEAELDDLVAAAVARAAADGAQGGRAMGAVMKDLKPGTAGRVDGAVLAAKVKAALKPVDK